MVESELGCFPEGWTPTPVGKLLDHHIGVDGRAAVDHRAWYQQTHLSEGDRLLASMWKRSLKIVGGIFITWAVLWVGWLTVGTRVASHPDVAGLLGTCTLAGCESGLAVDVGEEFVDGVVYDIEVCLDDECESVKVIFGDGVRGSSIPLQVEQRGTITTHLDNQPLSLTANVSLVVLADGEEIVRHDGEVTFRVQRPNGRFCEPTCYWGTIVL